MADTLYLSLWYPNLRMEGLPAKLVSVLNTFAQYGGEPRVYAATVWPVSWNETPIRQMVFGWGDQGAAPNLLVEEICEALHDDYAYEFQIGWHLWEPESGNGLDPKWNKAGRLIRVTGFGPLFDEGTYEADGHIRVEFGSDQPFLEEDVVLDEGGAKKVEQNLLQLIALVKGLEKSSGATARLLWSELGESLAERLALRLGKGN